MYCSLAVPSGLGLRYTHNPAGLRGFRKVATDSRTQINNFNRAFGLPQTRDYSKTPHNLYAARDSQVNKPGAVSANEGQAQQVTPPTAVPQSTSKPITNNVPKSQERPKAAPTQQQQPAQQQPAPTQVAPQGEPQQKPYGMFNRLQDIWHMLIDRIKLWWYQSKMKSGNMTADEWKSAQSSADRLSKNKTAMDWGKWWNPEKYTQNYFSGMPKFTASLPYLHQIKKLSDNKKIGDAYKLYTDNKDLIDAGTSWGRDAGYIDDKRWEQLGYLRDPVKAVSSKVSGLPFVDQLINPKNK
jgi:hypothetical protein